MGQSNSTVRPYGEGHSALYRKGVEAVEEGRYSVAELYFQQALKQHDGRAFWSELGGHFFGKKKANRTEENNRSNASEHVRQYLFAPEPGTSLSLNLSKSFENNPDHRFLDVPLDHRLVDILDYIRMAADIMYTYLHRNKMDPKNVNIALVYCGFINSHVQMFAYLYSVWLELDSEEMFATLRKAHEQYAKEKTGKESRSARRKNKNNGAAGQQDLEDSEEDSSDSDSSSTSSEASEDGGEESFRPLTPSKQVSHFSPDMQPLASAVKKNKAVVPPPPPPKNHNELSCTLAPEAEGQEMRVVEEAPSNNVHEDEEEGKRYFFKRRGFERHAVLADEVPDMGKAFTPPQEKATFSHSEVLQLESDKTVAFLTEPKTEARVADYPGSSSSSSSRVSLKMMDANCKRRANGGRLSLSATINETKNNNNAEGGESSLPDYEARAEPPPPLTDCHPRNDREKRETFLKSIRVNNDSITEEDVRKTLSLINAYLRYYWMVSSVNYCAISILYLKEMGLYGKCINEEEVGKMTAKVKDQTENKENKVSLKKANKVLENLMDVAGRTQYEILRLLKQPQYQSIKSTQLIIKQSPPLDYFLFPEEDEDTVLYDSRALTSNQLQSAADGAVPTGSEGASRHSGSRTKNGSHHSKNVESFFGNVTGAGHVSQQTFLYMAKEYTPAIPIIQHFNPASIAVHLRFNIYKKTDEEDNALSGVFKESGEPEAAKRKKKGDMVTVEIGNSNSQVGTELQSGNVLSGSQNGNNYNASDNMITGPKRSLLSKKELAKVPTPAERNTLFYTGWFSSRHIRYVPGCSHHLLKNTLSHYYNNYLFYNNKNFVQPQSALMVLGKEETCAFGGLLLSEGALEAYKQQLERKEKRARRKKEQQTGSASPTREPPSTTASAASTDTQSSVTTATATVKKNMFTAMVSPNKNLYLNDLKTIQLLELEECFIQGMILMIIHAKVLSDTQCKEKAKKFVKFVRKSAEYFYGSKSPEYKYFEQVISIYV